MICKSTEEQSGALCYPKCRSGFKGVGPVCWATSCPTGYEFCGPALCLKKGTSCAKTIAEQVKSVFEFAAKVGDKVEDTTSKSVTEIGKKGSPSYVDIADSAGKVIDVFALDICK